MSIQWYPGHMYKATKEIKEVLPKIDILIEVLDARIPASSENPVIAQIRSKKPCLKVLTKCDLADPVLTASWMTYFEQQSNVRTLAVSTAEPHKMRQLTEICNRMVPTDSATTLNAMIVGIPNVGKSTLINTISERNIAKAGNEPGVTKGQQKIKLGNGVMLWDTPGILWPKIENANSSLRLAVLASIKDTVIDYEDIACFAAHYLLQAYPEALKARYRLQELPGDDIQTLEAIGLQRGAKAGGGRVDYHKAAEILINDIRSGKLGALTWETPEMIEREWRETAEKIRLREAEREQKKALRKQKKPRR